MKPPGSVRLLPGRLFVAAAILLAMGVPCRADYIKAFSGNTAPASPSYPGAGVAGVVNFAVLSSKGTPGDTFGTGIANFDRRFLGGANSGDFDTSAKYLYLYETVNNGANGSIYPISQNSVFVTNAAQNATSYGSFRGTEFAPAILGPQSSYGNGSPATLGQTPLIVTGSTGRVPQILLGTSSIAARYLYGSSPELGAGKHSILWGYTSNQAPTLATTSIQDGGTAGQGSVPTTVVPVPEPLAIVTLVIGLPFLRVLARRRQGPRT